MPPKPSSPAREDDKQPLLVFERDFYSYHLATIRQGIQDYFDAGDRKLSFVSVGVQGLLEWFGPSVVNRMAVIGTLRSREAVDYFSKRQIPFLNLAQPEPDPDLGFNVMFEDEGTVAAKFFITEMGLDNLGFVGASPSLFHSRRQQDFCREASRHRREVRDCLFLPRNQLQRRFCDVDEKEVLLHRQKVQDFLAGIPKPAGVFCAEDRLALQVYHAACYMGINVPDELAILGVGSKDKANEPWTRAISIVQLDHHRLGFVAARLMDQYFSTGNPPKPVRIKPVGIFHSETTFRRKVPDPLVRKALMMIQMEPSLTVSDLCQRLKMSRPSLDVKFQRFANMTTAKAIEVERFSQARRLLRETNHSLEAIAGLAGYPSRKGMRRSFFRFTRMSPTQFRELKNRK